MPEVQGFLPKGRVLRIQNHADRDAIYLQDLRQQETFEQFKEKESMKKKFTFKRIILYTEQFEVEAESEAEALQNGKDADIDMERLEYLDTDYYELVNEEEVEEEKRFLISDQSGRGSSVTKTLSEIRSMLEEEATVDGEPAIDEIDSLDVGDIFDCNNIENSDALVACKIVRTV